MKIEDFWQEFLEKSGLAKDTEYYDCYCFCFDEASANELLALVLSDKKQATCSSLLALKAEKAKLPEVGDYNIITDFNGEPHCIVQTQQVRVIQMNEMTFEICQAEGEDDCLESWLANHHKFFKEEAEIFGYEFSENMPVVFENFTLIYKRED